MVLVNHSGHMEDSRFKEIKSFKKKELSPQLQWFAGKDYFSEELFGFYSSEIEHLKHLSKEAFSLFEQATNKIIKEKQLDYLGIPTFFHKTIEETWQNRSDNPFLYGRFDINGGLDHKEAKIIEFNADTCSTLPETIYWQQTQLKELPEMKEQFNTLTNDIELILETIKSKINFETPYFLASSFGHKEDQLNCNTILDIASKKGFKCFYTDLENVTFSEDEGIFYEIGGEFQPIDVWFKMIPWDWIFNEEPELAKTLASIIERKLVVILNPPYTAIWQNKKFLTYITKYFPNNCIAETYLNSTQLNGYVTKPIYGRLGENIKIVNNDELESTGDYAFQEKVFQKYYQLPFDSELYFYQIGLFFTDKPSALNLRAQDSKIITDDCEFMSHYII
ncbi:glutathionylspermidine synthase family protein [Flavobacterium sp. HNIBRBA15423]|uniref:glutathionylspermidine synthase family protein n=1 Tax=Flavobacterium sp. HNIBRBA15423 TaxID=3458683 RepID=UPI004044DC75